MNKFLSALKPYWPTLIALAGSAVVELTPEARQIIGSHHTLANIFAVLAFLVAHWSPAPNTKPVVQ